MLTFTPIPTVKLGFVELSTHGLLMAVAFLAAVVLARRAAKARGLSAELVDNAAIVAVVAGLVGARLVWVLAFGRGLGLLEILQVWHGGLSSHGGYVFGIIAGLAYLKIKKVDVRQYADAIIPYILIGWAIGRIGCFLNWDSFGTIASVPWAVIIYGEPRHATQLYESFGYLLVFSAYHRYRRSLIFVMRPGGAAAAALLGFSAVRFIVDFWRDDAAQYLAVSRIVTLLVIALAILFVILPSKEKPVVL